MTGRVGVAISTTGEEHRLGFLETCVREWDRCLPKYASLFVTVDGTKTEAERVRRAVYEWTGSVFRVGQLDPGWGIGPIEQGRLGVAANKNTGLELLMNVRGMKHLFLSDDDAWPLYAASLDKHIDLVFRDEVVPHSMVCWGRHRLDGESKNIASWKWPRGSVMYVHRQVVESVGGMDERFGPGGHEHVEWSNRIHNAGLTPRPFLSPASYATRNGMGAMALWHCEDMPRLGEKLGDHRLRRRNITSVRRADGDWEKINEIMVEREGSTASVSYRAHENGRASATLCADLSGAEEPAEPRSNK